MYSCSGPSGSGARAADAGNEVARLNVEIEELMPRLEYDVSAVRRLRTLKGARMGGTSNYSPVKQGTAMSMSYMNKADSGPFIELSLVMMI